MITLLTTCFKGIEECQPMFLKDFLIFLQRMIIETDTESSQYDTLKSAAANITEAHLKNGISARDTVINIMEATFLLPGIFNVQMLSWRQRLQDIVHAPNLNSGYSSLNYVLPLDFESANGLPKTRSVAVQTKLVNPNLDELLEFNQRVFELKWVLKS